MFLALLSQLWRMRGNTAVPNVETPLDLVYKIQGHPVRVRTINLNQDWPSIHQDILEVIAV